MHQIFEKLIEFIGWLQIVASPLLAGILIGAIVYFPNPTETNLIISIAIIILGLFIGIRYANRISRKKGTISFLSNISATPDIDKFIEENDKLKRK